MGILGGVLGIVGAIAAVVLTGGSALGIIAGVMLGASALTNMGVIGGSVGAFMKSGWGQGLTALAGLAAAGTALYGEGADVAAAGEGATAEANAADAVAGSAAEGGVTGTAGANLVNTTAATADTNMANIGQSYLDTTGTTQTAGSIASNSGLGSLSGTAPDSISTNASNLINNPIGAEGQQAAAQTETAETNAVSTTGGGGSMGSLSKAAPADAPVGGGGPINAPAQGAGPTAPVVGNQPGNVTAGGAPIGPDAAEPDVVNNASDAASGGSQGFLGKAADFANTKAGQSAIGAGGNMISGLGKGIMENSALEKQIQAQQWANLQWQNQSQVDQFQAAAAKPVTVPQGYLQRAQQVQAMMQQPGGSTPLPGMAPPPVPPAMQAPTAQTPRGGLI